MPNQSQTFLDKKENITPPPSEKALKNGQVPFVSALKLTAVQEQRMIRHALERLQQMETEQGRAMVSNNVNWFSNSSNVSLDKTTFMGRRSLYEMTYQNKFWWRKTALGGIFAQSNLTANFSRRIARQMIAQATSYYFGTDPWFATYPIGGSEDDLADILDEFAQFKIERSDLKACLCRGIEGAYVRGESVVKTTWVTEEQTYEQNARVLMDPDGKDILDVNGDWITDKDAFIDEMQSEVDPRTGKPIPNSKQPTGRRVLRKDMTTVEPPELNYEQKTIRRRKINFKGAKSDVVYWQDILIPETAPHIQRGGADIVIHVYDMLVIKLIDLYERRGLLDESAEAEYQEKLKALQLLRKAASAGPQAKSAVGQSRAAIGERDGFVGYEGVEPKMQVAECYMTFDANEDGETEEIVLIMDRTNKVPIFYDYLANATPDGERPFDVLRIQPIEGRWYGIGAMEMFEKSQKAIDLLINRWNYSQSGSARVTFWKPSNTLEGARNPNLSFNMGQTYTLKEGKTMEDTLGFVVLPEVKGEGLQKLMEFIQQLMMNEAGIASVNDGASAGLDTAKLATGVRNLEANNQTMGALYWGGLEPSLTSITRRNIVLEFANMKPDETFQFFDGNEWKTKTLFSEDVQDLEINVNILMSRYRNQQVLQSSLQAINSAMQYYSAGPQIQERTQKLYQQVLKALQIDNADDIISPLESQPGDQSQPAGQPQPQAQPTDQPQDNGGGSGGQPGGVAPVLPGKFFGMKSG